MDDLSGHRFQDRLGRDKRFLGASDHEGERPGVGTLHTTGDRGIDLREPVIVGVLVDLAGVVDRDGGAVDQQRTGLRTGQDLLVALDDGLAVREHGDHHVGVGNRLDAPGEHLHTVFLGSHCRLRRRIVSVHGVPGLDQVLCHGSAHVAQTEERDGAHRYCPFVDLSASARPITTRMISLVPSSIRFTRRSRTIFSRPYSRRYPYPPCNCSA